MLPLKQYPAPVIMFIVFYCSSLIASTGSGSWFNVNYYQGSPYEEGLETNHFFPQEGFSVEFGSLEQRNFSFSIYTSVYSAINKIYSSEKDVDFYTPIGAEWRFYVLKFLGRINIHPFWGFGANWTRMKFEGMNAPENLGHFAVPVGAQLNLFGKRKNNGTVLQVIARPYFITGNSLEQKYGFDLQAGIGIIF